MLQKCNYTNFFPRPVYYISAAHAKTIIIIKYALILVKYNCIAIKIRILFKYFNFRIPSYRPTLNWGEIDQNEHNS
jgi:hypothetical protein